MQTPKCDLVISNCAILPMNNSDLIMNGVIAVKDDGRITYVGANKTFEKVRADVAVEAKGKVAMPSLINCHTHVPMNPVSRNGRGSTSGHVAEKDDMAPWRRNSLQTTCTTVPFLVAWK